MKHDSRYKHLFSNPKMLEELFHSFVKVDFVKDIDFSTAVKLDKSFVSEEFKLTESDLIVRVNRKNTRQEAYLYLLLEFQSTPDPTMPIRVNAVSALFVLENAPIVRIRKTIGKIVNLLQQDDPETIENFRRWVMHFLGDNHPDRDFVDSAFSEKQRRNPGMFAKNAAIFMDMEREKGRKKGLREGRAEGRIEERLETARKMKAKGMSIQLIAEITELSEKEILEL